MATQAGLGTLRAGGNAFDAAVAVSLALGVCEPGSSGLGGDGFYHAYLAGLDRAEVFNGTGAAPLAATPERFASGIEIVGPRSVSVPGLLGGIGAMHAAHGRLPWAKLVQPAIALAREGFAATHVYCNGIGEYRAWLAEDPRSARTFLGKGLGALVLQPALMGGRPPTASVVPKWRC
jgi:gamma-glutamyltranspeptidase